MLPQSQQGLQQGRVNIPNHPSAKPYPLPETPAQTAPYPAQYCLGQNQQRYNYDIGAPSNGMINGKISPNMRVGNMEDSGSSGSNQAYSTPTDNRISPPGAPLYMNTDHKDSSGPPKDYVVFQNTNNGSQLNGLMSQHEGGGHVSEEVNKARKKAQNRAAQKAFRERKEARLKELEEKLAESENSRHDLMLEIGKLKKLNAEIMLENKVLLQKGAIPLSPNGNTAPTNNSSTWNQDSMAVDEPAHSNFSFPTEDEFYEEMVANTVKNKFIRNLNKPNAEENGSAPANYLIKQNTEYTDEFGRRLLTVPATWEYLSKLSEDKDFDVSYVMNSLKGEEVCDEHGPAYARNLIDMLVEKAAID
ncbi:bZIP transcription factor KNAG_0C05680 [Huiozyma naganishii CBS 8797]|uniref:BZIP domain-containing protein n=1 Tax=Huiozyma naganishii (strain ATCC MYA-139 / BCRC 22969 / CBS 8797 / KCTC 17520 / NBRC 10181 / NCYC 3082 / Yp74L-3) TaxID=1071383 RepID=J7S6C1_HUIN7|nr:hypothetical protein KNAG_0C05680 [Kazachstania naganishii CBS 8797]CCK69666.1 hypothetical protein KNAG_0C05680 [Kazachstania naganishii CBS 8797]